MRGTKTQLSHHIGTENWPCDRSTGHKKVEEVQAIRIKQRPALEVSIWNGSCVANRIVVHLIVAQNSAGFTTDGIFCYMKEDKVRFGLHLNKLGHILLDWV